MIDEDMGDEIAHQLIMIRREIKEGFANILDELRSISALLATMAEAIAANR